MSQLLTATASGSARDRGRIHGELFGDFARQIGIIDYYLSYCERLLPAASAPAALGFNLLHAFCARSHSKEARGLVDGFAEATGYSKAEISKALVMPDVLNFLVGLNGKFQPQPALACTSVAAWGDYTQGGKFLYGRNLDFPGNGYYDRFPVLLRHKPDQGIPYVSLTTAGGIVDGFTGINQEGITVALHQHMSRDVSLWGTKPILDLALEMLLNARSIDQAVALASSWKTSSGWTIVVTSWREKTACAIERTPSQCLATSSRTGVFARTNDFAQPKLQADEIDYTAWRKNSQARERRARRLLEQGRGRMDAAGIAAILRDHIDDERGLERAILQTIAAPFNMTSVVFDPEAGVAWVAEAAAPVCEGPYKKIALWSDEAPGEALAGVGGGLSAARQKGFTHYLEAVKHWEGGRREPECRDSLAKAVAADPDDPAYRYLSGFFMLRGGDALSALDQFGHGAVQPDIEHRQRAQRLWQARCLDAAGRRGEAVKLYEDVQRAEKPRRPLALAAQRGLARPYRADQAKKVVPDFFFADVYAY